MVRELKKYKPRFQKEIQKQQLLFQEVLMEFDEVTERVLTADPGSEDLVKLAKKIVYSKIPKRLFFDKFKRTLRDLEELWIDMKRAKVKDMETLFEPHEKDVLISAEKELDEEMQKKINYVKDQIKGIKNFLG